MTADRINIDQKDGIAIVTLKRDPANALNIEFAQEMLEVLSRLDESGGIRAVV